MTGTGIIWALNGEPGDPKEEARQRGKGKCKALGWEAGPSEVVFVRMPSSGETLRKCWLVLNLNLCKNLVWATANLDLMVIKSSAC